MLAIIFSWFGKCLVIHQWLNQTLCVSYFTKLILGSTGNWSVFKAATLGYIFNSFYSLGSFAYYTVIRAQNMCYLFYKFNFCINQYLTGNKSGHSVLYFSDLILDSIGNLQEIKADTLFYIFNALFLGSIVIWRLIKRNNMFYLYYWVEFGLNK